LNKILNMSNFMEAAVLPAFGAATVFRIEKVPVPLPAAGQVLVKVRAAGLNPVDYKTRMGKGVAAADLTLPAILGWDIAGEVVSLGDGVSKFERGDRIFGLSNFPQLGNAYAQYTVVDENEFTIIPKNITNIEAGATPLAALTAWEALFDQAGIVAGQRVLVHAASGGVGHFAVQLAKCKGCFVAGTASAKNHEFLQSLGVDVAIDYHKQAFESAIEPVDVVIDGMGGEITLRSLDILKPGGILVSLPSMYKDDPAIIAKAREKGVRVKWMIVKPDGDRMEKIATLLSAGQIKVKIDSTFPLKEIIKAHQLLESNRVTGKVVITI
jgi:NADPH2:quinone reductase